MEFRKGLSQEHRDLFARLALGQKPDAFFVACSDSRVVPNLFASTNPGDLFVLRNVGNLVPSCGKEGGDSSAQAALAFATVSLQVADIIVCGHSECGAMQLLVEGIETLCCPHLSQWLQHGVDSLQIGQQRCSGQEHLSLQNQVSQNNVLLQMQHIASYPFVQKRMLEGNLRIHGWWFDIAQADVYCYEESLGKFLLIDEQEAEWILQRLESTR